MPIFIVIVLAIMAVALVAGLAREKKRRAVLAGWARTKGLRFEAAHDASMERRFPGHSCLRQGSDRYAYNVMEGERDGWGICAFDYHYETYSHNSKGGTQTHHHHFSAVVLDSGLALRPLLIRPEGFFDKVTEFFGADDIDFESGEFSREFFVKSEDRRWAFDIISQRTMEFLLSAPRFHIQLWGPHVMAWRSERFRPVDFEHAVGVAGSLLKLLPEDIVERLRIRSQPA